MADETVRIERMTLRVPRLSQEEGRSLGQEVMRRVADGIPPVMSERQLDALNIKVSIAEGTDRSRMAKLIAEAILERMR